MLVKFPASLSEKILKVTLFKVLLLLRSTNGRKDRAQYISLRSERESIWLRNWFLNIDHFLDTI